jgi:hypothetical protein
MGLVLFNFLDESLKDFFRDIFLLIFAINHDGVTQGSTLVKLQQCFDEQNFTDPRGAKDANLPS